MGMFDDVTCKYPLPWPEVQDVTWQSKDTPDQYLSHYEIRDDGTLWCGREQVPWEGELEIHHLEPGVGYYSVRFWFRDGVVKDSIPKFWAKGA